MLRPRKSRCLNGIETSWMSAGKRSRREELLDWDAVKDSLPSRKPVKDAVEC